MVPGWREKPQAHLHPSRGCSSKDSFKRWHLRIPALGLPRPTQICPVPVLPFPDSSFLPNPAMPEPCPVQLQPSPIQTPPLSPPRVSLSRGPTLCPISVPSPAPNIQSPGKYSHPVLPKHPLPRPHQESKSPGSSRRGLWGRREAGAANAEGSELSPRKLKTRPTANTLLTLTANLTDLRVTVRTPRPHTQKHT